MNRIKSILLLTAVLWLAALYVLAQAGKEKTSTATVGGKHGTLVTEMLTSSILKENRIGIDPIRRIKIFLPPGYTTSGRAYPVVYICHNFFYNNERMFNDIDIIKLIEQGFANGVVKEFILVAGDYSTPTTGSLYENSPVSGRWLDFTVNELVPFIDGKYRTLKNRDSRAITGHFMGGRGALKLAMVYPEIFGVVYAMHPVATGNGALPWSALDIDWKKIYAAKTFAELQGAGRSQIFITVCQAFLPNLNRPPFYCDYFKEPENGEPKLHPENVRKAKTGFHLDETLNESAANLRTMRGLALDWGRFDETQAHVISNREFSRLLEDLAVEHEAEEFRGNPFNSYWGENGRFYTRVLPFLEKHLVF